MDKHPIWGRGGELEIQPVAFCPGNLVKLRPDEPLSQYADFDLYLPFFYNGETVLTSHPREMASGA